MKISWNLDPATRNPWRFHAINDLMPVRLDKSTAKTCIRY